MTFRPPRTIGPDGCGASEFTCGHCPDARDGEVKFLARDTVPPYGDTRLMLVAGKPELRNYKAAFVVADQEVTQFSDETTVNPAQPM